MAADKQNANHFDSEWVGVLGRFCTSARQLVLPLLLCHCNCCCCKKEALKLLPFTIPRQFTNQLMLLPVAVPPVCQHHLPLLRSLPGRSQPHLLARASSATRLRWAVAEAGVAGAQPRWVSAAGARWRQVVQTLLAPELPPGPLLVQEAGLPPAGQPPSPRQADRRGGRSGTDCLTSQYRSCIIRHTTQHAQHRAAASNIPTHPHHAHLLRCSSVSSALLALVAAWLTARLVASAVTPAVVLAMAAAVCALSPTSWAVSTADSTTSSTCRGGGSWQAGGAATGAGLSVEFLLQPRRNSREEAAASSCRLRQSTNSSAQRPSSPTGMTQQPTATQPTDPPTHPPSPSPASQSPCA